MRRLVIVGALVASVLICVQVMTSQDVMAYGGSQGPNVGPKGLGHSGGGKNATKGPAFVLVEHTGLDVNCTVGASPEEIEARITALTQQNKDTKKTNSVVQSAVDKLGALIAAKKDELAKAKDDTAKAEIQKAIEDLKAQVTAKKTEIKPLVKWDDPKQFDTRQEADAYVTQVMAEANKAKMKAIDAAVKKASE